MTPHDMPRRRPSHVWTPPVNYLPKVPVTPLEELTAGPRHNARHRRATRNGAEGNGGWARQKDDVN